MHAIKICELLYYNAKWAILKLYYVWEQVAFDEMMSTLYIKMGIKKGQKKILNMLNIYEIIKYFFS